MDSAPDRPPAAAPEFSIVTPSRNMLGWLKRCRRSIADQEDVAFEHLVMDAASTDGTPEWLADEVAHDASRRLRYVSEKDDGMYDAVNRGFDRARGEILGYLNCDEQYLPGTLAAVRQAFAAHPEVDLVFGHSILIRPDGSLIALQKSYPLRWWYVLASTCYVYSCTLFLRASVFRGGQRFEPRFRDNGDAEFLVRLDRAGHRSLLLPRYLAAFGMTGSNMSGGANARAERAAILAEAPGWVRALRLPIRGLRRSEKFLRGGFREAVPFHYEVYDAPEALARQAFRAETVSFQWSEG